MFTLRKPRVTDVSRMVELMRPHIHAERLLPRSPRDVAERLRDYVLAEHDGVVVGLASVTLVDTHIAEVGALASDSSEATDALLAHVLAEVEDLGVDRAFVMTDDGEAFERHGFVESSLEAIPEKRDRQCLRCARLPRCQQRAFEVRLHARHALAAK